MTEQCFDMSGARAGRCIVFCWGWGSVAASAPSLLQHLSKARGIPESPSTAKPSLSFKRDWLLASFGLLEAQGPKPRAGEGEGGRAWEKKAERHTLLSSLSSARCKGEVEGGEGAKWAKSKTPQKREQRSSGPGSSALPSEGQGPVPNKASPCQKAIPLQAEPQTRRSYSVLELSQVVDMRICVMSFQSRLGVECCSGEALNSHAHNSALCWGRMGSRLPPQRACGAREEASDPDRGGLTSSWNSHLACHPGVEMCPYGSPANLSIHSGVCRARSTRSERERESNRLG